MIRININYQDNYIKQITLKIGAWNDNKIYILKTEESSPFIEFNLYVKGLDFLSDDKVEKINHFEKKYFFERFKELHIGEWHKYYDIMKYGEYLIIVHF